ncbi:MAG: CesT family type III secretion system chaperone [Sandaracinus sp.]|nr:CesT family type III secretion system chaperone [Sandaracinus sp.]MCB9622804.1 CesT family type III secretion system chaperone [Sandaracinus sp.]
MRTRQDIESYLLRSNLSFNDVGSEADAVDEAMWLVRDHATGENIVVSMAGPLLLFRVKVLDLDHVREREPLFQRLLELNAQDMVHGAYGLADGAVVLTAGLPLENLDYNEFQVTVDDLTLALNNHYEHIKAFVSSSTVA